MTKKIELLKEELEAAIHKYCEAFAYKHEMDYDHTNWVGSLVGGVVEISDMFLGFDDIRLDLEKDCPKTMIHEWYSSNLYMALEFGNTNHINYNSWIMGARHEDFTKTIEEGRVWLSHQINYMFLSDEYKVNVGFVREGNVVSVMFGKNIEPSKAKKKFDKFISSWVAKQSKEFTDCLKFKIG